MTHMSQVIREAARSRLRRFLVERSWGAFLREEFVLEIPVLPMSEIRSRGYFSQLGQDIVLDNLVFREMLLGTFIDVGAHDGVTLSNSFFLESARGWSGVCVEPNPTVFAELARSRRAAAIQAAVSSSGEETMRFLAPSESSLSMLGGLKSSYSRGHFRRLVAESKAQNSSISELDVRITSLHEIAEDFGLQEPDLLLIDVEGAELDVLHSADWRRFRPKVILIESNYRSTDAIRFLRDRGYELLARLGWDRMFVAREFPLRGLDQRI